MLVALTPATRSGAMSAAASASRTHSQISAQSPSVSNTCEPGTSGQRGVRPFALPEPELRSADVEDHGAAAAGAGVDRKRDGLAHRASTGD